VEKCGELSLITLIKADFMDIKPVGEEENQCFCGENIMKRYHDSIYGKLRPFIAGVLLGHILLLGCQSKQSNPQAPQTKAAGPPRITLEPGDVVEVKFFYTPELNENQEVRPDGKIALQLIGEVEAQGKTPSELRDELLERYSPHLKTPEIAVVVRSLYNRRVFVGGQVIAPGIVQMPGKITALEAIMQAGGFDMREAELKNVIVIRYRNEKRLTYQLNLKPTTEGDSTEPFFLEPKDIVYVPRTEIAKLDQWIDQHINKIIPDTGVFYHTTSGNDSIGVGSYR